MNGEDFIQAVTAAYEEIIHWRRNLFLTPSGKAGKLFVSEMARLFRAYGEGSALESIALKAAMIMPALLLQKPYTSSKAREHATCLQRRLISWKEGDIDILICEGCTIQKHLRQATGRRNDDQRVTRIFTKLMFEGKVRAAMRVLSVEGKGASLPLDGVLTTGDQSNVTVRDELAKKHPPGQPADSNNVLDARNSDVHPVLYECIDGAAIPKAAIRTNGSAGPSGLDACGWKRLCTSFQNPSVDLCNSLAVVARRICSFYVDPEGLAPFTACRLIALDKCPGIRPIGVGETSRRIIGKAILSALMPYIQESAGSLQLCAGQQAGCEAAVHAMRHLFDDSDSQAVLLVDATNAFNHLNRQTSLLNIHSLCPSLAPVLTNTYRSDVQLHIDGETLYSCEGTTQGDPLAMAMYAIGILPLVDQLNSLPATQVWYADDAAAGGKIEHLHEWWVSLKNKGPSYGYHANPAKTWLIVKKEYLPSATELFAHTGVNITVDGKRHLGAALGS